LSDSIKDASAVRATLTAQRICRRCAEIAEPPSTTSGNYCLAGEDDKTLAMRLGLPTHAVQFDERMGAK
jgi:hypothetical protein